LRQTFEKLGVCLSYQTFEGGESRLKQYSELNSGTSDSQTLADESQLTVQNVIKRQKQYFSNANAFSSTRKASFQEPVHTLEVRQMANINNQRPIDCKQHSSDSSGTQTANMVND
jgi:hypothetical protein